MAQTEDVFLRPTYDYAALSDRSIIYCRIAATTVSSILFSTYEISVSNYSGFFFLGAVHDYFGSLAFSHFFY